MKTRAFQFGSVTFFIVLFLAGLMSCTNQSKGFILPDGDAVAGKAVFTELNCNRCHSVADIKWSGTEQFQDPYVKLGGDVSQIKTYGELVTSVINPSHEISRRSLNEERVRLADGSSKMEMYKYNEIMTVQELVDVVTFLQQEYNVVTPENPYPNYGF